MDFEDESERRRRRGRRGQRAVGNQMHEQVDRIPALESKVTMLETEVRSLSMQLNDSLAARMKMEQQIKDLQVLLAENIELRSTMEIDIALLKRLMATNPSSPERVNQPKPKKPAQYDGIEDKPTKLKSQGMNPLEEDEENSRIMSHVEVMIAGKKILGLLASGTHNFISEDLANELKLKVTLEPSAYMGITSVTVQSNCRADRVPVTIGDWRGAVDLVVIKMDVVDLMLGHDFYVKTKSELYYPNFMLIREGPNDIFVNMINKAIGEPGCCYALSLRAIPRKEAKHESTVCNKAPYK